MRFEFKRPIKALFLDDSERRHNTIKQKCMGTNIQLLQAYTAQQFLDMFTKDVDVVFLDHDLSEEMQENNVANINQGLPLTENNQDGRWVCGEMTEHPKFAAVKEHLICIIHSLNPVGSEEMREILQAGGFNNVFMYPFAWNALMPYDNGFILD